MAESSSSSSSPSSSPSSSTSTGSGAPKNQPNSATENFDDTPEDEDTMTTSRTTTGPASGKDLGGSSQQTKQRIRASTEDNVLEPDAMRGSEQHLRDVDIQDDEEDRRDAYRTDEEKQARQDELSKQADARERRAKARENQ